MTKAFELWARESGSAQRIETVTSGTTAVTYVGVAGLGADPANPSWQIRKIVEDTSVPGTVATVIYYPTASDEYRFVWNDRAIYDYL